MILFFSNFSTVIWGAPRLVAGAPRCSQTCCWHSQVHSCAHNVLSGAPRCFQTYHNHSHRTPAETIRDPSYSEGRLECPPRVWYSPEIDTSNFTLHILSDTPGGFKWLIFILLTGSRSYIHGLTPKCDNAGITDNPQWTLYSVYAVLGVCCT